MLCVDFPQVQYFFLSELVHVLKSVTIVITHFLSANVSPEWRSRLSDDEIAEYSNKGSLLLKRRFARTFGTIWARPLLKKAKSPLLLTGITILQLQVLRKNIDMIERVEEVRKFYVSLLRCRKNGLGRLV